MESTAETVCQSLFDRASRTVEVMREVLAEHFGIVEKSLEPDRPLDTLGLDSLTFVEYLFDVEKELKITLPDVPSNLKTVGELVLFIDAEFRRQAVSGAG